MKKAVNFFKSRKILSLGVIAIVIVGAVFLKNGSNGNEKNFEVKAGDFLKSIEVSGKVVSTNKASLSFDVGGTISSVNKDVGNNVVKGEIIASLDFAELRANRNKAEANYKAAQAELDKLVAGESEVGNKRKEVVNSIIEAYTTADDSIRNKVDQFFDDPRSGSPEIKYSFEDYFDTRDIINPGRVKVEEILVAWKKTIDLLTENTYKSSDLSSALKNLKDIKNFLDDVSLAVNSFETSSELTQAQIESYRSDLSSARNLINEALSDLVSAQENLRGSVSDIPVQEAKVKASLSEVESLDAQISQRILRAPFSGIVSVQNAELGESVSAHQEMAVIIGSGLEIEVFIPELSIAGVSIGSLATVEFDAFPKEIFDASIIHIDPAETVRDGVSNYKVILHFTENTGKDLSKIRSGMTADVVIITEKRESVLLVPDEAILKDGEMWSVFIPEGDKEYIKISIKKSDELDSNGNRELLDSNLNSGDKLLDPKNIKGRTEK